MPISISIEQDETTSTRKLLSSSIVIEMSNNISPHSLRKSGSKTEKGAVIGTDEKTTSIHGLTSREAALALDHWGLNDVTSKPSNRNVSKVLLPTNRAALILFIQGVLKTISEYCQDSLFAKYLEQFKNPLIALLMISAIVSLLLGQIENSISITLAVFLVVTVAFIQEWRTEKSLEELNRLAPPKCRVMRDGVFREMLASELVPDDLVEIHTGDRIPADLKLCQSIDLEVDESMLSGETSSRRKGINEDDNDPEGNIVFMATLVRQGYGRGHVIATGPRTRFGKMYSLMKDTEEKRSPLQCHLDQLGHQLSAYSLVIIAVIGLIGFLKGQALMEIFTVAVSLAVAAIPEGLPIVATITLALGVLRLSRRNVIVKKLPAVEALGSIDVLCFDKTGTVTMNELTVQKVISFGQSEQSDILLLEALSLCNNAHLGGDNQWHGNAVDVAIRKYLDAIQFKSKIEWSLNRLDEVSFTSERKFMAVQYQEARSGEVWYFVKGAPEAIIPLNGDCQLELTQLEEMYQEGFRVIAVCGGRDCRKLDILGLVAMSDPPRINIDLTIQKLKKCYVKCVMITGDSRSTAVSIARRIGLEGGRIIEGKNVYSLPGDGSLEEVSVIYRANPEDKLAFIKALQQKGHVVAMTGDGVNDAPALKMADIGIAMGRSGTDVARAAAQIILTDDSLGSLVVGIEEGKGIFSNIRHFVRFQLSTSLAALGLISASIIAGTKGSASTTLPMNAMQILLVNIIMDGPPAQSLGVEPVDPGALNRPPRPRSQPILSKGILIRTATSALIVGLGTGMVRWWWETSQSNDTTRTFCIFVLFSVVNAAICRSPHRSIFSLGLTTNPMLLITSILSLTMLLAIVYLAPLQAIFKTKSLAFVDWIILGVISCTLLIWDEFIKFTIIKRILIRKRIHNNNTDYTMELQPLIHSP